MDYAAIARAMESLRDEQIAFVGWYERQIKGDRWRRYNPNNPFDRMTSNEVSRMARSFTRYDPTVAADRAAFLEKWPDRVALARAQIDANQAARKARNQFRRDMINHRDDFPVLR